MSNTFSIYDPPMCCSSGVCGPQPNQVLVDFQQTVLDITRMGATVERFLITQSPEKFKENPAVINLIQERQLAVLPITTFNGSIIKTGSYPTLAELSTHITA